MGCKPRFGFLRNSLTTALEGTLNFKLRRSHIQSGTLDRRKTGCEAPSTHFWVRAPVASRSVLLHILYTTLTNHGSGTKSFTSLPYSSILCTSHTYDTIGDFVFYASRS